MPMGNRCAYDPASSAAERDLLCAVDGLPMGGAAQDLLPKSTVHDYLELWSWPRMNPNFPDGLLGFNGA